MSKSFLSCVVVLLSGLFAFVSCSDYTQTYFQAAISSCGDMYGATSATDVQGNSVFIANFQCAVQVSGQTLNNIGNWDAFIAKYTPTGTLSSVSAFQSSGQEIFLSAAFNSINGKIYAVGSTNTAQGSLTIQSGFDGIIVTYDTNLNLISVNNPLSAHYFSGVDDAIGGIIFTGGFLYIYSFQQYVGCGYSYDGRVFKLDTSFTVQWTYDVLATDVTYSRPYIGQPLAIDALYGNVYFVGSLNGNQPAVTGVAGTPHNSQNYDGYIYAFNGGSGSLLWVSTISTPNDDGVISAFTDTQGFLYVCGWIRGSVYNQPYSGSGYPNPFIGKYDNNGNLQWFRTFPAYDNWLGVAIVGDNNGALYTTFQPWGNPNNQQLTKLDLFGNVLWTYGLGGSSFANSYVVAINSCGYQMSPIIGNHLQVDPTGGIVLSGGFSGSVGGYVSNYWATYINRLQVNTTCACDQFNTVLTKLETLLNVVVV